MMTTFKLALLDFDGNVLDDVKVTREEDERVTREEDVFIARDGRDWDLETAVWAMITRALMRQEQEALRKDYVEKHRV